MCMYVMPDTDVVADADANMRLVWVSLHWQWMFNFMKKKKQIPFIASLSFLFRKSNNIFQSAPHTHTKKMNNGKQLKQKLNDNPESWRAADDVRQWADNNHRKKSTEMLKEKRNLLFLPFAVGWLKWKSILN